MAGYLPMSCCLLVSCCSLMSCCSRVGRAPLGPWRRRRPRQREPRAAGGVSLGTTSSRKGGKEGETVGAPGGDRDGSPFPRGPMSSNAPESTWLRARGERAHHSCGTAPEWPRQTGRHRLRYLARCQPVGG